jgi:Mn-dependent DtxR family transcriptional regulator
MLEKGWISDPKKKARSVWLTDEGARLSEELFQKHLSLASSG